jgi:4-hydroxy-3-methylbut-2-enyl diphosphate reductase IspH
MIEKSWLSTLKPILQSFSDSQNKIAFATQGNMEVRASKKIVKYFANLIRNYHKINNNTTTNITQAKYFA